MIVKNRVSNERRAVLNMPIKIESLINQGYYSYIYKGIIGTKQVVVKAAKKKDYEDLIEEEARVYEKLGVNPHTVPYFGVYKTEEFGKVLILDLPENAKTLKEIINEENEHFNQISDEKAFKIVEEIAKALKYVHSKGYFHNDLKDSNLLIINYHSKAKDIRAKIIDFNTAVKEAYIKLSPSPEETTAVNPDIESFGDIIYEVFTNKKPNSRYNEPVSLFRENSGGIQGIIENCWMNEYESVQEIIKDLKYIRKRERTEPLERLLTHIYESLLKIYSLEMETRIPIKDLKLRIHAPTMRKFALIKDNEDEISISNKDLTRAIRIMTSLLGSNVKFILTNENKVFEEEYFMLDIKKVENLITKIERYLTQPKISLYTSKYEGVESNLRRELANFVIKNGEDIINNRYLVVTKILGEIIGKTSGTTIIIEYDSASTRKLLTKFKEIIRENRNSNFIIYSNEPVLREIRDEKSALTAVKALRSIIRTTQTNKKEKKRLLRELSNIEKEIEEFLNNGVMSNYRINTKTHKKPYDKDEDTEYIPVDYTYYDIESVYSSK